MSRVNRKKHQKQKKLFYTIIFVFISIFLLFFIFLTPKEEQKKKVVYKIDLPTDKEDSKNLWAEELETENKNLEKRLQLLEQTLNTYQDQLTQNQENFISEIQNSQKKKEDVSSEKKELEEEIIVLKKQLIEAVEEAVSIQASQTNEIKNIDGDGFQKPIEKKKVLDDYEEDEEFYSYAEQEESLVLPLCEWTMDESDTKSEMMNVCDVIPAGTTVKALLISTLDAPCGVNANSDPQPIKLRVLDNAHLPKKVQAKLKGCLIIGSGYGNLSSERVWMRTERITKVFPSGNFIETEMSGYITGEDGRYGVRGVIVDKTGKLIWRAGVSGFFSGLNQYLQATVNAQDIAKATCGLPNDVKWDVLKNSSLQGASSSLDKLTEYYIKRAEQLLPVIQVGAGRVVDITFTHNVRLGDIDIKNKLKVLRERSRIDVQADLDDNDGSCG